MNRPCITFTGAVVVSLLFAGLAEGDDTFPPTVAPTACVPPPSGTTFLVNGNAEQEGNGWNGRGLASVVTDSLARSKVFRLANVSNTRSEYHQTVDFSNTVPNPRFVQVDGWIRNSIAGSSAFDLVNGHGYILGELRSAGQGTVQARNLPHYEASLRTAPGGYSLYRTWGLVPNWASLLTVRLERTDIANQVESGNVAFFDNITVSFVCSPPEGQACNDTNRPRISGVSPNATRPGSIVTVTGTWRTGPHYLAACHWRQAGRTTGPPCCFFREFTSARMVGNTIQCRAPSVPGENYGPVFVSVSVWHNNSSASDDRCASHWGTDDDNYGSLALGGSTHLCNMPQNFSLCANSGDSQPNVTIAALGGMSCSTLEREIGCMNMTADSCNASRLLGPHKIGGIIHLGGEVCCGGNAINPICGPATQMCASRADFKSQHRVQESEGESLTATCEHVRMELYGLRSSDNTTCNLPSREPNMTLGHWLHLWGAHCCRGARVHQMCGVRQSVCADYSDLRHNHQPRNIAGIPTENMTCDSVDASTSGLQSVGQCGDNLVSGPVTYRFLLQEGGRACCVGGRHNRFCDVPTQTPTAAPNHGISNSPTVLTSQPHHIRTNAPTVSCASGTNSIINGDAESGASGWTAYPMVPIIPAVDSDTGSHVFVLSNATDSPAQITQAVKIPPSAEAVIISGWVSNVGSNGYGYIHGTQIGSSAVNDPNRWVQLYHLVSESQTGWQKVSGTSPIVPNANAVVVMLARSRPFDQVDARFDNISVSFQCRQSPSQIAPSVAEPTAVEAITAAPSAAPILLTSGTTAPETAVLTRTQVSSVLALNLNTVNGTVIAELFKTALLATGVRASDIVSIAVYPGSVIVIVTMRSVAAAEAVTNAIQAGSVTIDPGTGPAATAVMGTRPPTMEATSMSPTSAISASNSNEVSSSTVEIVTVTIVLLLLVAIIGTSAYSCRDREWDAETNQGETAVPPALTPNVLRNNVEYIDFVPPSPKNSPKITRVF